MGLLAASWQHHCVLIPEVGQRARAEHDCGPGSTLLLHNKEQGYSAWCFRCAESGFIPHPAPSLSERLARLEAARAADRQAASSVALPAPAVLNPQEWPDPAAVWLYKAGLSNDDIMRAGFYYHPPSGRVVLPVLDDTGTPTFWQARSITGAVPKYLNPGQVNRSNVVYKAGEGPVLCLTEDILSAYRVGQVTSAWSVMGVNMPDGVALQIVKAGKPVGVMLDPDAAGERGNTTLLRSLSTYGINAKVITIHRDPKLLTKEEIKCALRKTFPAEPSFAG